MEAVSGCEVTLPPYAGARMPAMSPGRSWSATSLVWRASVAGWLHSALLCAVMGVDPDHMPRDVRSDSPVRNARLARQAHNRMTVQETYEHAVFNERATEISSIFCSQRIVDQTPG